MAYFVGTLVTTLVGMLFAIIFVGMKSESESKKVAKFMQQLEKPFGVEERELFEKKIKKEFANLHFNNFEYEEVTKIIYKNEEIKKKEHMNVRFSYKSKNQFIRWLHEQQTRQFAVKKKTTNN